MRKDVQVYTYKHDGSTLYIFRDLDSRALSGKYTLLAMNNQYKGSLIKENSLNIYYKKVKDCELTIEQKKMRQILSTY